MCLEEAGGAVAAAGSKYYYIQAALQMDRALSVQNPAKNLIFCHGCGRGGDVIRFTQLCFDLPFHQAFTRLQQELALAPASEVLEQTAPLRRKRQLAAPDVRGPARLHALGRNSPRPGPAGG